MAGSGPQSQRRRPSMEAAAVATPCVEPRAKQPARRQGQVPRQGQPTGNGRTRAARRHTCVAWQPQPLPT
eukprot:5506490-Alexandrium_andersonii.AAC.1